MTMIGADPDALDRVASMLERTAEGFGRIQHSVGTSVAKLSWAGNDAGRFRHEWKHRHKKAIGHAIDALDEAARLLRRNANEQRTASAANSSASPGIPGMPAPPKYSKVAGKFDSDPLWTRLDDIQNRARFAAAATAALIPYPDAARLLLHYLEASGEPYKVDPDKIMKDVSRLRERVQGALDAEVKKVSEQVARDGGYGRPRAFSSNWEPTNLPLEQSPNWKLALGNINYSVTGVAMVHAPESGVDDPPRVEVEYKIHVYDRYDFGDEGWGDLLAEFFTGLSTADLREMHRAGQAREFAVRGSSEAHRATYVVQ